VAKIGNNGQQLTDFFRLSQTVLEQLHLKNETFQKKSIFFANFSHVFLRHLFGQQVPQHDVPPLGAVLTPQ
jgi:hypothetical protein